MDNIGISNDNPLLADPLPVVEDFENGVFPPTGWLKPVLLSGLMIIL